jgi:hydroxymethylglutaryl-CoA lyase
MFKINESPRDAMQALSIMIPTEKKTEYINGLLKVGFKIIDLGSFVSPHLVPQMSDTPEVLKSIIEKYDSEISVLAGNSKYAEQISEYDIVDYIGYPFAISETFQKKNLNSNFENALNTVENIVNICIKKNKKPNISISTAFGNPYDDDWGIDIIMEWIEIFYDMGLRYFPLADTTGSGSPHLIGLTFKNLINEYPDCEFNLHLHSTQNEMIEKLESAYLSGCRNMDTVINGHGGCPMTGFELIANTNTLNLIDWLDSKHIEHGIKKGFLDDSVKKAFEIFPKY